MFSLFDICFSPVHSVVSDRTGGVVSIVIGAEYANEYFPVKSYPVAIKNTNYTNMCDFN